MKHLRIGLLHYSCPPVTGGVETVMRHQSIGLASLGHDVHVLAGIGGPFHPKVAVTIDPAFGSRMDEVSAPAGNDRLLERLSGWSRNLDVVLAHNVLHMPYNLPLTMAVHRLAARQTVPVIDWAHDAAFFYPDSPDHLHRPPWDILKTAGPNLAQVTISEARKRMFEALIPGMRPEVVPNGIDPAAFWNIGEDAARIAAKWRFADRDLVMLQPVRLLPHKNLGLSIRITAAFRDRGVDALLAVPTVIDANDPASPACRQDMVKLAADLGVADRVAFLLPESGRGAAESRRLVTDLYLLADMLLMTSRDEGFGLTLLEAGLARLPVACSAIPPFLEVARGACFFPLEAEPEAIAGGILEYLEKIPTRDMTIKIRREYVWDRIVTQRIVPLLEKTVREHRKTGASAER